MTNGNEKLLPLVQKVAQLRARQDELKIQDKAATAAYFEQHKDLFANLNDTRQALWIAEEQLRKAGIEIYEETREKHPHPTVEIKVFSEKVYEYTRALEWATKHQMALKLDQEAFERIADSIHLDFVVKVDTPKVHIKKDLSQFLLGGDGEGETKSTNSGGTDSAQ
jgi:hypothetical protein